MEKPEPHEKTETSEIEAKKPSAEYTIPRRVPIEDILRALKILSDKGGKARFQDISGMFGPTKSQSKTLSYSLGAGDAFGLIEPHRGRAPYVLSKFGTRFLTVPDKQKKTMLLPRFLGFEGYKNVLVQMKNTPDKTLKKEVITDAWLGVKKTTLGTRKFYTTTFASVSKWCGAITDTGQTCSLTPEGESALNQILKGEKVKPTAPSRKPTEGAPPRLPTELSFQVTNCPLCGKAEFDIENEELLNTVSADGTNVLIIKYTFYCRGCRGTFSRIGQHTIKAD